MFDHLQGSDDFTGSDLRFETRGIVEFENKFRNEIEGVRVNVRV